MARAREEESEMNFATGQTTPLASTVYFNLDDDVEDVLAARPDRLYEVRPQPAGVLRHRGFLALRADPRYSCAADGGGNRWSNS